MYPIVTCGAATQKANLPNNAIYWEEQSVYNSVEVASSFRNVNQSITLHTL